ncbi:hypothetical protein ACFFRE_02015 [Aciditerrimonas ferrireducens]|uniref:Uncharacterized protein n=1 Tax=Aciditerrimonas ferrireducens TaxID=667306 RepID=A0ABV6BZR9_9ACTN
MAPRRPQRSQAGAQAEARRRLQEKLATAEEVLAEYLAAGEQAEQHRREAQRCEQAQEAALAKLAGIVGRAMAAEIAGVDESKVRAALARRHPRQDQPASPAQADDDQPDPTISPEHALALT